MQYRQFGKTELLVSEVGFGAWAIGGAAMIGNTAIGWGEVDDTETKKAIHRSLDLGINFFDTADIYGLGHSEEIIGASIGKRKDVIIASKGGNVSREGQFTVDYSFEHLIKACEDSLKRLKRDHIDYYQLHSARKQHIEEGECLRAMEQLKQDGKIRYWGLSLPTFEPGTEAKQLMDKNTGDGFQLVLNIINQRALPVIRETATKGYGIIARMPLQFGLLTGKFDTKTTFSTSDHRNKRLPSALIHLANETLGPAWKLCNKYNINKTQLALSYVLSYPELSIVIPGIRTTKHAEDNTTGLVKLEKADVEKIELMGQEELMPVMEKIVALG
ncbi:MAG TPA: aldo/keto reductase [Chitinophagaceae bacterium]|nr:aldo/keto reductase [Chitinophagaceae bacterium]